MDGIIKFPLTNEYPTYVEEYMNLLRREGGLLKQLKEISMKTIDLVLSLSKDELLLRPSKNNWSIKEILVHIIDDERIYAFRALSFARNDKTYLPGFDIEDYTKYSDANTRSIESILEEYKAVRIATIALFKGFSEKALVRTGTANGNSASVRALGYHIAGHELVHIKTITEDYLKKS
ncbi:MAG: DNA damage-inducible protein DinB [Spirochaetes bacterium]|nr:MAG: DNA damage-inducible protein DinB [Spirochaetota bacterium]